MSSNGRHRFAVIADRLIVLGVLILIVVAACAALDDSSDASVVPLATVTPPTATTSTTTTAATTTTVATTTVTPTTTLAPTAKVVSDICESLRSDGFESRRAIADSLAAAFAAAGGEGDGRAEVAAECADALDRLEGAVEIRDRMQTIDIAEEDGLLALVVGDLECDGGTFDATVTNTADIPLGFHVNFAMYRDGDREDALQSSSAPIVMWSIEPGGTESVSGTFDDVAESKVSCTLEGQLFDADPSSIDASLADGAAQPALTGDDPSAWFPALYDFERDARSSGDIDLGAVTEDVRSMSYDEVAWAISENSEYSLESELVEVCERGRSRPDADHIGFVYLERVPDGTRLSHGLFRRGADGQWRSLSRPRYFESTLYDDCRGVDPGLADIAADGL